MGLSRAPLSLLSVMFLIAPGVEGAPQTDHAKVAADWVKRFGFVPPSASTGGVCAPSGDALPAFTVTPAAAGRQLVRGSIPFAAGTFPAQLGLAVRCGDQELVPDVRPLTFHPGRPASVRRAIVTFPFDFPDTASGEFTLVLRPGKHVDLPKPTTNDAFATRIGSVELRLTDTAVEVKPDGEEPWRFELIAPARTWNITPTVEVIEQGEHHLWARMLIPDADWPRIIEVRADSLGTVAARLHLQHLAEGDERAPDTGWRITGPRMDGMHVAKDKRAVGEDAIEHAFSGGQEAWIEGEASWLRFPDAHLKKRGLLTAGTGGDVSEVTYLRCRADEQVPHQHAVWRSATLVLGTSRSAPWTALLEPVHEIRIEPSEFDAIYHCGVGLDLSPWPRLEQVRQFHIDVMAAGTLLGDDFGNVTSLPKPGVFGMNRLNHCPPIFHEHYRSGDRRLREVALHWCNNYHDLIIWWGTERPTHFGATRYNNMARHHEEYRDDKEFMWRSNSAVTFCTKGYDSFLYAYEETGDPRMATALRWQVAYARQHVHTKDGECRNIGDVLDFVRLYEFTREPDYLEQGLRLFRELRTRLSEGDLFSQGGGSIVKDPPFIDNDKDGYNHPFAKPYIIGYGLAGLPSLAGYYPDEPKLRDVIRAVADFQAGAQDPVGGWRYPHPRSSRMIISQGIEHAAQLARAAEFLESRGEPIGHLLDAIERVLQARILGWAKTGTFLSGLGGWETAAGILKDGKTMQDLYARPEDRDPSRDYAEGSIGVGGAPPDGVVYFTEVLDFYLAHRPAERLFHANGELSKVLDRTERRAQAPAVTQPTKDYIPYGVASKLPAFRDRLIDRLTFPLSYAPGGGEDFARWRSEARDKLLECLLVPPARADFQPVVIAREDRGTYEARKIVFSVSADCRVPAYLLVPKGKGPFPAMIALHDHGAHFLIGKEKVVRPFDVSEEIRADAQRWIGISYGGRFIGDELAKRGYVVLAMDALFWGERAMKEGPVYDVQQALSSNLLQMGITWIGVVTWDDMRSAEFVASLPEVDPQRIGAVGLSMGCHRTWMLGAATDRIAAGVAVCWLGTTEALMSPGNNQAKGHSAYSMLVPDLRNFLDYPDVASIACPKPMMFYNGEQDGLFPVAGVEAAYAKMHRVWKSQGAGHKLVTKIWPWGHVFNVEMQEEAFGWLDGYLWPGPEEVRSEKR